MPNRSLLLFAALLLSTACGGPSAPETQACANTLSARSSKRLSAALGEASVGDCVVLGNRTFVGSFRVPAGVALVAGVGKTPVLQSDGGDAAVLQVEGGEGTTLAGLTVRAEGVMGIEVRDAPASLVGLTVSAVKSYGIFVGCPAAGCTGAGEVSLEDSELRDSRIGLWVDGAIALRSSGNHFADNTDDSALPGYGVTLTSGASWSSSQDTASDNRGLGIVADGADTRANIDALEASRNGEGGVWLQNLVGSANDPAFSLSGPSTVLAENGKVGLASIDSVGIIMGTAIVRDTRMVHWVDTELGDGIALGSNTAQVELSEVTLSGNGRAQLLVDYGGAGIIMGTAIVDPSGGLYGVVIQNTVAAVSMPNGVEPDVIGTELPVDIAIQAIP